MRLRNYGTVQRVEVAGSAFLLGWIPRGILQDISLRLEAMKAAATRRALLVLRAEHAEDGRPPPTEEEVRARMVSDPVFTRDLRVINQEVVGWGVRGHENVLDETNALVPFQGVYRDYFGQRFESASDEMVARYEDAGILLDLAVLVFDRNRLDDEAKKNWPPRTPSAAIPGGGSAPTA
jgi:hypothetical protein